MQNRREVAASISTAVDATPQDSESDSEEANTCSEGDEDDDIVKTKPSQNSIAGAILKGL